MADEEEGMRVPYLSATRLKIAKDCSLYYEHQYDPKTETAKVLKKKSNHPSNTQAARLGNIVHGALEDWRMPDENGKTPPAKFGALMRHYERWASDPRYSVDLSFYEDGKALVRRWFDRRGRNPIRVLAVEQAMGSHSAPFRLDNGVPIFGFIDLIVEHKDGTIELIDYKTNRANKTQDEANNDVQAGIYLAYARQMWPDRPLRFSFEMLRYGVVSTVWDDERIESFKGWLKTQYESIKALSEGKPSIGESCRWCPYQTICPAVGELMSKGAFDLVESDFSCDDDALDALATIKAAQGVLTARRKSIEKEFRDRLYGDQDARDNGILTDSGKWEVVLEERSREQYIPSEVQRIVPPAVFGQMAGLTKTSVEKALPILPADMAEEVKKSAIKKPFNAMKVNRKKTFEE
jgi:hypothetical protein